MIYFPYPTIRENANVLVKADLIKQTDYCAAVTLDSEPVPPEWVGFESTLTHIALAYMNVLSNKYSYRYGTLKKAMVSKLKGAAALPDWYSEPKLNENQQGFMKWLGLCRLYFHLENKIPDSSVTIAQLKALVPPKGIHADYSHFEVEPTKELLVYENRKMENFSERTNT